MKTPFAKLVHRHIWLIEPLADEPTLLIRPMFGGKAVYLHGKFVLFLADRDDPWRGVLIPTEREHQTSLIAEFPALAPHPVLPKWLYLPETADSFETDAQTLVVRALQEDLRIGIVPAPKRPRYRVAKKK